LERLDPGSDSSRALVFRSLSTMRDLKNVLKISGGPDDSQVDFGMLEKP
jgi:hypothetical protein